MYIVLTVLHVHSIIKKKIFLSLTCFLREVYLHSGTELIPLFPYLRAGLQKGGGGDVSIAPGNRLLATDHGLTGLPDLEVNPGLGL